MQSVALPQVPQMTPQEHGKLWYDFIVEFAHQLLIISAGGEAAAIATAAWSALVFEASQVGVFLKAAPFRDTSAGCLPGLRHSLAVSAVAEAAPVTMPAQLMAEPHPSNPRSCSHGLLLAQLKGSTITTFPDQSKILPMLCFALEDPPDETWVQTRAQQHCWHMLC